MIQSVIYDQLPKNILVETTKNSWVLWGRGEDTKIKITHQVLYESTSGPRGLYYSYKPLRI